MTEEELIEGCKDKKQECQKLLFDTYAPKMMALCNRYTNNRQEAQDILQDGFIRVFDCIKQYRYEGSFEGWIRRVFVSIAAREISKRKMIFIDADPGNIQDAGVDPEVISKMSEAEIQLMIRDMPDGYRTVFNLNIIEGYSHEEIAVLLGIKSSTSRVQLMKAKKYLQSLILKKNHQEKYEQVL